MSAVVHGPRLILQDIKTMTGLVSTEVRRSNNVTLVDALDKVLEKGAVINGDIVISVADVDLVFLGLRLILTSVSKAEEISGKNLGNPDKGLTPEDMDYIGKLQKEKNLYLGY